MFFVVGFFNLQVSFGDFAPYMILAEDSLVALNKELPSTMEMERFRPNIVVSGLKAFEEVSLITVVSRSFVTIF